MDDIHSGRRMARLYVAWSVISLLGAGCGLAMGAAFHVAYEGTLSISHAVWSTHAWVSIVSWAVPFCLGLVGWLMPLLKQSAVRFDALQRWSLALLILATGLLAAHPALLWKGQHLFFLQPLAWAMLLAVSLGYAAMVWRISGRSLRPSTADVGIQSGAAWLLVVMVARVIAGLGSVATGREDFLASSDAALLLAAAFGFIANTGLGLAVALLPEFLQLAHARPQVQNTFSAYNVLLAMVIGGLMWCLPFPPSWGRFLLVACGFAFGYYVFHLVTRLQLLTVVFAHSRTSRQLLARLALATGLFSLILSGLLIALLTGWLAGTMARPPEPLINLAIHLATVGFFGNVTLGLLVPLLGNDCLRGLRGFLATGGYALLGLWILADITLTILTVVRGQAQWYEFALSSCLAGGAFLCLGLWTLWGFAAMARATRQAAASQGTEAG